MGVHTYGSLSVGFEPELNDREYEVWEAKVRAGRTDPEPCSNSHHKGQFLNPETGQCPLSGKPKGSGYCYSDSERFDPDNWVFEDDAWGDVGIAHLDTTGFEIESGGKVYDIVDMVRFTVACLPSHVQAHGSGAFESDSQNWVLHVQGREVSEDDGIVVGGDLWNLCLGIATSYQAAGEEFDRLYPTLAAQLRDLAKALRVEAGEAA